MTSPIGCLRSISSTLKRRARKGDVDGLRAYVRSDAFLAAFNGLAPQRRRSAMRAFANAETWCEAKAARPLPTPKRIDAKRVEKVNWSDPVMVAKLAEAYALAEGDDEKAARILHVTLGSARLARRRHLDNRATLSHRQNAVEPAGTANCVEATLHPLPCHDPQRHALGGVSWAIQRERVAFDAASREWELLTAPALRDVAQMAQSPQ